MCTQVTSKYGRFLILTLHVATLNIFPLSIKYQNLRRYDYWDFLLVNK